MADLPVRRSPATDVPTRPAGRRLPAAPVVALVGALTLAGCGGGAGGGPSADARDVAPAAAQAARQGDAGRGGEDRSAAWPGRGDDVAVIARQRIGVRKPLGAPASMRPTADMLIRALDVHGRVATLRFTMLIRGWDPELERREGAPSLWSIHPGRDADIVSAQLIDPVNLRRYRPLEDSAGEEVASMNDAGGVADGLGIDASWISAAPPAGVDSVDVQIGNWPVFRDVPVTRG